MSDRDDEPLPGKGLFGWLGRQVGHVRAAVRHDPMTLAKRTIVDDRRDPDRPGIVFRRTTTDEVRREEVAGDREKPPTDEA